MKDALGLTLGALLDIPFDSRSPMQREAIAAAREALAQPEQEPVAWMSDQDVGFKKSEFGATATAPLYTTPPKRTWVGLTDAERDEICLGDESIARAIEAKLKEKNT